MKKNISSSHAYILVLTMMILALATIIVTYMSRIAINHVYFNRALIERAKACELARGGIEIGLSLLNVCKKLQPENDVEQLFVRNFPRLNQKQTYVLKEGLDGIDAILSIIITSEDGKINLNNLFDFKTKKFVNEGKSADARKYLEFVCAKIEELLKAKELFKGLEKFLKSREYPLEDVTELLAIPQYAQAFKSNIFNEMVQQKPETRLIYLTDLFTVFTEKKEMNSAYLSDSILTLWGLQSSIYWNSKKRIELVDALLKDKKVQSNQAEAWNKYLKLSYGKEFKAVAKEASPFLSFQLESSVFSVLSYATVGTITQKVFAIVKKQKISENRHDYTIERIYWL